MEKTFKITGRQDLPDRIKALITSFHPGDAKPDFEAPGHFKWCAGRAVAKVAGIPKMATGHLTVYRSDDMKAEFFERHLEHEETFNVLGDGAFVTVAGLPTDTDKPDLDKLWALVVNGGESLRVPADYWHCVPYSLEKEKTVVAITYNPDQVTEFWHIPDSDRIAIG